MNINHKTLINNLIPVMWPPGSMGAFFMRFIEDDNFKTNECRIVENLEWENWDRIYQYLHQESGYPYYEEYLNKHLDLLKEKYVGDEYNAAFIYVIYQLTEHAVQIHGKFSDHHLWPLALSNQYILELAEKKPLFDIDNLKFTHLKLHLGSQKKEIVTNLNWKAILFCHFPEDKTWLSDILLYYKKYFYKMHKPLVREVNKEFKDWNSIIKRLTNPTLISRFDHTEYRNNKYINIDMYDLIFNRNTDQLLNVYPNFVLTNTQRNLLDQVKEDILYICNVFGLDHNISLLPGDNADCLKTKQILDILKRIGPEGPI